MIRRAALLFALLLPLQAPAAVAGAVRGETGGEQRIPFKRSDDVASGMVLRVVGSLLVVALLGVGVVYVLKRYLPLAYRPGEEGTARIRVVEVRRLTPKTTLHLIDLDGTRLLLGSSGDRLTTLYDDAKSGRVTRGQ